MERQSYRQEGTAAAGPLDGETLRGLKQEVPL